MKKILELFGGLGSMREALKDQNYQWGYVENDKWAVSAYNALHKTHEKPIDICKFHGKFKEYEGIVAGFPCQDVSIAGKNDLSQGRTLLYLEMLRIIDEVKPNWVILENVKGLLQKKHSYIFNDIKIKLYRLGYFFIKIILSPRQFGIPQNRPRVFMIASHNFQPGLKKLEQSPFSHPPLKTILEHEIFNQLEKKWKEVTNYCFFPRRTDSKLKDGSYNRVWKIDKYVGTLNVINSLKIGKTFAGYLVWRDLTTTECARLMGWDRGIQYFNTLSKHRARKLLGNAICVPILRKIWEVMQK